MDRENFYQLLELAIDPLEENAGVIDAALKRKQADWSRLRNHPTKGVLAQKYIGLIPEIRRVMAAVDLRRAEAQQARELLQKDHRAKMAELERHLEIRMSKGYLTEDEITKLADLHAIGVGEVQRHAQRKQQEKLAAVDKHLEIRMGKGYVSEAEIARLAKLHRLPEDEVRQRVKCPIGKQNSPEDGPAQGLDASLAQVIEDNLKIVGKSSLYDFLDLPPSSSRQLLLQRAKAKEAELSKTGKKDAFVTANATLAGQCSTLFKTEAGRTAYDLSRARIRLTKLDADIDVAGLDGKIRSEYFDMLVKSAIEFGLDRPEACEYIAAYCRRKGYRIESDTAPVKRRSRAFYVGVAGLLVVLMAGGAGVAAWTLKSRRMQSEYQKALVQAGRQTQLEDQISLLNDFIAAFPRSTHAAEAGQKIRDLRGRIAQREFEQVQQQAADLIAKGQYEQAGAAYRSLLAQPDANQFQAAIERKISEIGKLQSKRAYAALDAALALKAPERLAAYREYLKKYPDAPQAPEVHKLIADMREEVYIALKQAIAEQERLENWPKCAEYCVEYAQVYTDGDRTAELAGLLEGYRRRMRDASMLAALVREAEGQGHDYAAAQKVYSDYLRAYPGSSVRDKVEALRADLEQQEKTERLQNERNRVRALLKTSDRFVEQTEGTLTDTRTGLTWALLDSQRDLGQCIDYEVALRYVKDLQTGGFRNWRLPKLVELTEILTGEFLPPAEASACYWSSQSFTRYSSGWSKVVDTVKFKDPGRWEVEKTDSRLCGSVYAVRP